jgi:hypothetical protein
MDAKKTKTVISEEAKLRAKNYMRLKDGYVEPKQETLEEVAERLYPNYQQEIFIEGAKWQQTQDKNKYSDEEVLNLLIECSKWQLPQTDEDLAKIKQWFAEFKKK